MIRRKPKTDEQLFIDWASADPDWLTNMPLNKANLERYKGTIDFAFKRLGDRFATIADNFMDTPEIQALQKSMEKAQKIDYKPISPTMSEMKDAFKDQKIRDVQAFEIAHGVLKRYEIVAVVTTETGEE